MKITLEVHENEDGWDNRAEVLRLIYAQDMAMALWDINETIRRVLRGKIEVKDNEAFAALFIEIFEDRGIRVNDLIE